MADMENNFKELKDRSGILLGEAEHAVSSGTEGEKSIRELKEQNRHVEHNVELSYKRIKTLETYSEKIADIVGVISDISSETELLSLNASIEAARAGDAGRGFAVVAESIGKLAADSTSVTRNIGKIIVELCKEIETTVFDIEKVKNSMVVQMKAAQKVEEIFESYKELAGQTGTSAAEQPPSIPPCPASRIIIKLSSGTEFETVIAVSIFIADQQITPMQAQKVNATNTAFHLIFFIKYLQTACLFTVSYEKIRACMTILL